jgi:GxxExxY protein
MRTNTTTNTTNGKVVGLVYPELSYTLMGILFEVHNKLGTKYQEKHYQRAIEIKLKELGISYEREKKIEVTFEKEKLGDFFVDFVIDDKIILEIKMIWHISKNDIKQVLRYLKATGLRLAVIANFKHQRLEFVRVLN